MTPPRSTTGIKIKAAKLQADVPPDSQNAADPNPSNGNSKPKVQVTVAPTRIESPKPLAEAPEVSQNKPGAPGFSIQIKNLSLYYGSQQVLDDVSFQVPERGVTALIGPSGCGKSSLLRCINRMNDHVSKARVLGQVTFEGLNIYAPGVNASRLRRFVGMVFQRSNPFPKSIFENVAFGLRLHRLANNSAELEILVEDTLRRVGLWEEVKDRLQQNAMTLSGGQQQRLCIARAIAIHPKVILMDEPASALDPLATAKVEELVRELQKEYTILIVTHNLQQASRCSDYTAFLYMGRLIEFGETGEMFSTPKNEVTENYIMGRFG